jgi:hypothetical protein
VSRERGVRRVVADKTVARNRVSALRRLRRGNVWAATACVSLDDPNDGSCLRASGDWTRLVVTDRVGGVQLDEQLPQLGELLWSEFCFEVGLDPADSLTAPKSGLTRTVPMADQVQRLLKAHRKIVPHAHADLVFPGERGVPRRIGTPPPLHEGAGARQATQPALP